VQGAERNDCSMFASTREQRNGALPRNDAMCDFRTHALQQRHSITSSCEQRLRQGEPERFSGLKVDDQLKTWSAVELEVRQASRLGVSGRHRMPHPEANRMC
jgi:hypothetical protein